MSIIKKSFSILSYFLITNIAFVLTIYASDNSSPSEKGEYLNVSSFGTLCYWNAEDSLLGYEIKDNLFCSTEKEQDNIGIRWWEARDIQRFEIAFDKKVSKEMATNMRIEYWQDTWPEQPPHMSSFDDLEDDLWQGKWIVANTQQEINGNKIIYTFNPLGEKEISSAKNLPGEITYRRTLKIRIKIPSKYISEVKKIDAFSMAILQKEKIQIEFLNIPGNKKGEKITGNITVFNGFFHKLSGWNWQKNDKKNGQQGWELYASENKKGIIINAWGTRPLLPGSNEETIITVKTNRGTFSFSSADLSDTPMYIPNFGVYVTGADNPAKFNNNMLKGQGIREQIAAESEQTYERASKEIPAKDPTQDQYGGRIYLPLACDASWQKFAVEWGGNILIDGAKAKAQGKALELCNWKFNELNWKFGTGALPVYERTEENCRMSILNNYLPVVTAAWQQKGLLFEEETFVTFPGNTPLSPFDKKRNEYTPAILMVKIKVSNPSLTSKESQLWLQGNQALTNLTCTNGFVYDHVDNKEHLRVYSSSSNPTLTPVLINKEHAPGIHYTFELNANSTETFYFYFPFIGNLTSRNESVFTLLNYEKEKERVTSYWRDLVADNTVFTVPEAVFNQLSKAVIPHIRMGVTKDPESGLFMVPAASLVYPVYANESIFQTVLMDRLGDSETANAYLETFLQLQGSRKLPGAYTGEQEAVFHGVKVSDQNDLTAVGYNMNHGTVLWGLAHHYLYSKDTDWLKKAAPKMKKAADWIIEQRNHTKIKDKEGKPVLQYGLLPAGMLEDCPEWKYWYATNAYSYLGMVSMAEAFEDAGLAEADYYREEAETYRNDILNSVQKAIELSPVIRLRNNVWVPYVPTHPYQKFRYFGSKKTNYYDRYQKGIYPTMRLSATREVLYGPVTLLKTGIIDAFSPMADWILDDWEENLTLSTSMNLNTHGWVDDEYWFSRGGMVFQANLQNPVSVYLDRHETKAAIRSLYNNFTSLFYPDIIALSEEYRMWKHASGPMYKTPDEARVTNQIIDLLLEEKNNEIWLGNGIPQRWLEPGEKVELKNLRTRYGTFSYILKHGDTPNTIHAEIWMPEECPRVVLFIHDPFKKPIREVSVNGRNWNEWNEKEKSVVLPKEEKYIQLIVNY